MILPFCKSAGSVFAKNLAIKIIATHSDYRQTFSYCQTFRLSPNIRLSPNMRVIAMHPDHGCAFRSSLCIRVITVYIGSSLCIRITAVHSPDDRNPFSHFIRTYQFKALVFVSIDDLLPPVPDDPGSYQDAPVFQASAHIA